MANETAQTTEQQPSFQLKPNGLPLYARRHIKDILLSLVIGLGIALVFVLNGILSMDFEPYIEFKANTGTWMTADIWKETIQDIVGRLLIYWSLSMTCVYLIRRFRIQNWKSTKLITSLLTAFAISILLTANLQCAGHWVVDNYFLDGLLEILPLAAITCILCQKNLRQWLKEKRYLDYPWLYKITACILTGFVSFILLETQINQPIAIRPWFLFHNIGYWCLVFLIFYIITFRIRVSMTITPILAWFIGAANQELLQWRGDYILTKDLLALQTAVNVADQYQIILTDVLKITLLLLIAFIAWIWLARFKREHKKVKASIRIVAVIAMLEVLIGGGHLFMSTGWAYGGMNDIPWNVEDTIHDDGYMLYFLSDWQNSRNNPPEHYDIQNVQDTLDQFPSKQGDSEKSPTIIVIQNESWSDPRCVADVQTDKSLFEYIDSLSENTQKGYVATSVPNGPTSVTEFEFICQASMYNMTSDITPFITAIDSDTLSLASTLEAQDSPYRTVFFHPYPSSGYNRVNVYNRLGFDEQIYYDTIPDDELPSFREGIISDKQDFLDIIKLYEQHREQYPDQPLFLFNVTIQSHGGYFEGMPDWQDPVRFDQSELNDFYELYSWINLMHETDMAFETLVDYFSKQDDPVIILMYGDHQAGLNDICTESLNAYAWNDQDTEPGLYAINQMMTPYVLWANYDIPESDNLDTSQTSKPVSDTSVNWFGTQLLELTGLDMPAFDVYCKDLMTQYPVFTRYCRISQDREMQIDEEEQSIVIAPEFEPYANIQYNRLFDYENQLTEYYFPD